MDGLGTLFEIIQSKMEPFCEGNSKEAINQLFANNQLACSSMVLMILLMRERDWNFFFWVNQLMPI